MTEAKARASVEHGSNLVVPYVASWSGEQRLQCNLIVRPDGAGVAYATELPGDRDNQQVLWARVADLSGAGTPQFATVHPSRQMELMTKLLCQVCADPADETDDGILWLLPARENDEPGWPEHAGLMDPPICRRCVPIAIERCPELRRGYVLIRVRKSSFWGVFGTLYRRGMFGPVPTAAIRLAYGDPQIGWMVATKLVREVRGCSFVDVDELCGAASVTRCPNA